MVKSNINLVKHFSLNLLLMERLLVLAAPKITTGQIMDVGNVFHKDGLFSNTIFGEPGSKERNRLNGHIELKLEVLHPLVWIGITSMSSLHKAILSSEKKAKWDSKLKDFVEDIDGETGFNFFMSKIDELKFENPNNSDLREFKIKLLDIKDKSILKLDKVLALAAGLRDYTIDKSGKPSQDEINEYYRTLINMSNIVPTSVGTEYNAYIESIRMKMQKAVVDIHLHSLNILTGKRGLIQGHLMSKAVDHGTRNVITADNSKITQLGQGNHLRFNNIGVGLYQHAKAINPISVTQVSRIMNNIFSASGKTATVINIKTLESSIITIDNKTVETYTSRKGINNYLNKFADNKFAKAIFGSEHYCYAMILEKDGKTEIIYDTYNIEDDDRKYLRPITNLELLYIALLPKLDSYYASTTRYPAINQGSEFPVKPIVKPTVKMVTTTVIINGVEYPTTTYPNMNSYIFDSLAIHQSKLANAGADYDGDTMNYVVFFTKEANAEINKILNNRAFYIGADGKVAYSVKTSTLNYVIKSMKKLTAA